MFSSSLRRTLSGIALSGLCAVALAGCGGGGNGLSGGPAPGGNPGGGNPGGGSGSGSFTATFSNARGTNADTSMFSNPSSVQAAVGVGAFKILSVNATKIVGTTGTRIVTITVDTNAFVVGKSYSLDDSVPDSSNFATLAYTETQGTAVPKAWTASGGSIVIDSISGKTYKVRIVNATMIKDDTNDTTATGSFTLNGGGTVTTP